MTYKRPKGGFAKTELNHYGVGAWRCYDSTEFELRGANGMFTLWIFGKTDGDDKYMNNYTNILMDREQVMELARYLDELARTME